MTTVWIHVLFMSHNFKWPTSFSNVLFLRDYVSCCLLMSKNSVRPPTNVGVFFGYDCALYLYFADWCCNLQLHDNVCREHQSGDYVHCAKEKDNFSVYKSLLSTRNHTCIQFFPCQFDRLSCENRNASKRNFSWKVTKIHKWASVFYLKYVDVWYYYVKCLNTKNAGKKIGSIFPPSYISEIGVQLLFPKFFIIKLVCISYK